MAKTHDAQTRIENRRAAILDAAQTCFFQYGLERTRMEDIARLAQISRPALYEHFENKSAIFVALARHLIASFLQDAERELQGASPVWKRIAAAFEVWSVKPLEMIMAAPHADEMILAGSGLGAEVYREGREKFCQSLTSVLREAAKKGELDLKRANLTAASAGPVHHYHKDGAMRFFETKHGNADAYYEPNSFGGPQQDERFAEPPLKISGDADRYSHRTGNDDYTQAGNLFRLFDDGQRQRLFSNIAAAMQGVPQDIIDTQLAHFDNADPAYGEGVRKALK